MLPFVTPFNTQAEGWSDIVRYCPDPRALHHAVTEHEDVLPVLVTHHQALAAYRGESRPLLHTACFALRVPGESGSLYASSRVHPLPGATIGSCFADSGEALPGTGILLDSLKGRTLLSLPFPLLQGERTVNAAYRPFFSAAAGRHFVETGPAVDTGAWRRVLRRMLMHILHGRGLPWSERRLARNYLALRIDADGKHAAGEERLKKLAAERELSFTWFLDMEAWEMYPGGVRSLVAAGHEVQLHCYLHMTYRSAALNRINLRKGRRLLERSGVEVTAAVSPNGFYFPGYEEALLDMGFSYASDFAYDVNNLPSYIRGDASGTMQIPACPLSRGVIAAWGLTAGQTCAVLEAEARAAIARDGFAVLYEHPYMVDDAYAAALGGLLDRVRASGIEIVSMGELHRIFERGMRATDVSPDRVSDEVRGAGNGDPVGFETVVIRPGEIDATTDSLPPDVYALPDADAVRAEIASRQWILAMADQSVPGWYARRMKNHAARTIRRVVRRSGGGT